MLKGKTCHWKNYYYYSEFLQNIQKPVCKLRLLSKFKIYCFVLFLNPDGRLGWLRAGLALGKPGLEPHDPLIRSKIKTPY